MNERQSASDHIAPDAQGQTSGPEQFSLLSIVTLLLDRRRRIIWFGILVAAVAVPIQWLTSDYVVTASFMPEGSNTSGSLPGLAATLGVLVGPIGDGESLQFYGSLVRSNHILAQLLEEQVPSNPLNSSAGPQVRIVELLELPDPQDGLEELPKIIDKLRKTISVATDLEAGMVRITTRAPGPQATETLSRALLELVNDFNLDKRQSRAHLERLWIEERLSEATKRLADTELDLQTFLENNRAGETSSPRLAFQRQSLQRQVDQAFQLTLGLQENYEQARIEEIRNTPVVTVLDQPEGFAERDSRLLTTSVLAFLFGAGLAIASLFLRIYLATQREVAPATFKRFQQSVRTLWPLR